MDRFWAVTKREYAERVRSKWFVISTIFAPLFFGVLMVLPPILAMRSRASSDVAQIAILDASGTDLARRVALDLNGGVFGDTSRTRIHQLVPRELPAAESAATAAVMRRETRGYLVFDSNTVPRLSARYAGSNASSISDLETLRRSVRDNILAIRLERAGVDPAQTAALTRMRLQLESERITARGRGGSGSVSIVFAAIVAFTLYLTIILYGQNVLRGVLDEKQNRVAEMIVSSVPTDTLLAGKVVGVGGVGLTQLIIWAATSVALVKIRGPILAKFGVTQLSFDLPDIGFWMAVMLLFFFVLGYTFYAALFAAVGAMVNTEQEAQQAQYPIMLMLVSSVVFLQSVLSQPEGSLARVMSWLPFSSPVVMPLRLSIISLPPAEIAISMLTLVMGCALAVWLAARIYRVGLLMYGKRPTVREIAHWVRYAR
ncbi:MAG: ABC transporter permease [Gemmatimonadaceae bacterium]